MKNKNTIINSVHPYIRNNLKENLVPKINKKKKLYYMVLEPV